MALLDGFKLIELKEKEEESILTIGKNVLKFNRGTARDLALPDKVRFMINDKLMQLAIMPTTPDDEDGVPFSYEEGSRDAPISVKELAILNAVKKMAVFEKDGQETQMVLEGTVYLEERVIIYDLTEARLIPVKPRGRRRTKAEPSGV